MLILSRRAGESITIGDDIVVTVVAVGSNQIRLGIEAPRQVRVLRQEIVQAIKDENHLRAYRAYMAQMEYSRPFTIAPNTPKDRLEILRRAFKATLGDGDFLAQAAKLKLDINYVSGEECEKWVDEVLSLPPKIKEELKYLSPAQ